MKRPRIALGLESSRASLNVDACRALGRALAAAREARKLDVREVAARLLLSPVQVHGLERAESEAFYSSELYLVAARKYDALVGLSSPLLDELIVRAPESNRAASSVTPSEPRSQTHRRLLRPLVAATMAGTVTVAVGAWLVFAGWPFSSLPSGQDAATSVAGNDTSLPTLEHLVTRHRPTAPVQLLLKAPEAPSATTARAASGNAAGYVRVPRTTWVFVRYQDNSVVERVISPGDTFALRETPVYLAAGVASGADVVIDGERIDTDRFDVNGQLRIGSAFLSAAARHR
jgi:transcriptional regulator with XRE-family HTH domain